MVCLWFVTDKGKIKGIIYYEINQMKDVYASFKSLLCF